MQSDTRLRPTKRHGQLMSLPKRGGGGFELQSRPWNCYSDLFFLMKTSYSDLIVKSILNY